MVNQMLFANLSDWTGDEILKVEPKEQYLRYCI